MLFAFALAVAAAVLLLLVVLKRSRFGHRPRDLLGPPRGLGGQARTAPPPAPRAAPVPGGDRPRGAAPVGDLPEDVAAEARQLLARGRKIEAVKLVRAATGCSLEDAVDHVERL